MKYRRITEIGTAARGPGAVRAAAIDDSGNWYLGGDDGVVSFDAAGDPGKSWVSGGPVWSLAVDVSGRIWVGEPGQIELFDAAGRRLEVWQDAERFALVTAIDFWESEVFVADAGSRWIHRFDDDRNLVNHIGDRHRKGGFHIPNGIVDFAIDMDGTAVVANPGMHRVERYRPDGEQLGYFGRFGQQDPAGFPGCCNPTNIALGPAGEVVVSEKAGPRVKVYDPQGNLQAVVADGDDFAPECKNMDLVVTGDGRIGVLDPVEKSIAIFASASPEDDAEVTS